MAGAGRGGRIDVRALRRRRLLGRAAWQMSSDRAIPTGPVRSRPPCRPCYLELFQPLAKLRSVNENAMGDPFGFASNILYRQAYTHSVAIIFAYSENPSASDPPTVYGGSGGLIEFDEGAVCVVTCHHVLRGYERLIEDEPRYRFQVGRQPVKLDRIRDRDEVLDLAVVDVTGLSLPSLGSRSDYPLQPLRPPRWPNEPIRAGEIVVVCGFPADTRELDRTDRRIVSGAFTFVERVTGSDVDAFHITFDRSTWVNTTDDSAAPPSVVQTDLGGMSGSAVFSAREAGGVSILEFVGTLMSVVPFIPGEGVLVRSSRKLTPDGRIVRATAS
jgi:Trypsin-like peptidase domain